MNNPTIVSAALSDKELQDSINRMVANFDKGLQDMLDHSNKYVEKIQESLQKIGNTNFGAKGSNDGGVVKQTKAQNDFTDAVKKSTNEIKRQNQETTMSFDNIASATTKAARSASTFIQSERESLRMRQNEIQARIDSLRKQFGNVEIKTIVRDDGTFSRAIDKAKQKIEEIRRQLQNVPPTSTLGKQFSQELQVARNEYNELIKSRKAFEAQSQIARLSNEYEQNNKKIRELATAYKQVYVDGKQAESAINSSASAIARYGDSAEKAQQKMLKAAFNRAINILPQGDDLGYAKLERLRAILADHRFLGALSPSEIKRARAEVQKLESQLVDYISKMNSSTQAQHSSANATNQSKKSLDELNAYIQQNIQREQERRNAIRQTGLAARETANQLIRSAHEQTLAQGNSPITRIKELTVAVEQMRQAYFDMSTSEKASPIGLALEADIKRANDAIAVIKKYNQSLLGSQQNDANKITNASTLNNLRESLKNLTEQYNKLTVAELNAGKGDALIQHFQNTTRAAQILQRTLNRPVSLKAALSGDERTLDDIAYKMQRLRAYKQGIDLTKPNAANEIKQVDEALARLQKDADKWMSKSQQMIKSNTALGRSWNYMKNRLAFYFTVSAGTQFIKNLIEVRSQYEMNERALGILIDSAERGTQIFNELSQMALVSPYTLIELSSAAKQLTAYDVAAKDVVDTTRRLADMAAAVGIPIERLTYALGQIKAYGYLNSRDARMFANAGIPLVKQLSDYYTELEGKLVSTADVYDRIKKKAIDYNEVMEVINKMTDKGGKFFDFQAKMADTLKVRLANLTLAWNNMLNDIGKSQQGVLTWGIGALKELFLQWKNFYKIINDTAKIAGFVVALRALSFMVNRVGIAFGAAWSKMALAEIAGARFAAVLKSLAAVLKGLLSPIGIISILAIVATQAADAIWGVNEAQKALNESIRNGAKDNYDNISKFLEQYKEIRESLYATQKVAIGNIYNPVTRKAEAPSYAEQQVGQDIDQNEAKKAWEAVREQIELTVVSSDKYIGNLLSISNMSERVRQGFNLLDDVQVVNAALKELDDDTIIVSKDLSAWWNAWQAPDGLIGNLKDYQETLNDIIAEYGTLESFRENTFLGGKGSDDLNDYETALERFRDDLQKTTDSIINFIELKGWSGDESKINQVFEQIIQKLVLDNQLDPQKAFTLQTEVEEARSNAAKQALLQRINDEKEAYKISRDEQLRQSINADVARYNSWNETNGRSKVEWERFTKWLKEQHISETTAMFRNMDAEDIKSLNFQEGKHAEWVTRMVTQYAKEHKMSYDEAFKYLKNWVRSANQWSIYIPITISTEDKKSVYDQLGEYDKAIDAADAEIERLTTRIDELRKKKELDKNETDELTRAEQELADARKAKADAKAKGGHGKKEKKDEKAANKAAKQAESELAKALKDELSTIDKVRSIYKDLTKEGMSHANAVERATRGWDETVNAINRVLQKNGLQKLDLSKFAGIENPRELVNMLQSQLNTLLKRGAKPAEIKELQTKIQTLNVDAEKYDLTKITKGLNNELGKLKDEYELAVELDANPELGNMFTQMFGLDTTDFPRTIDEYMQRVQQEFDKMREKRGFAEPLEIFKADDAKWESWGRNMGLVVDVLDENGDVIDKNTDALDKLTPKFKEAQGVAKKWATDTVNNTKKLEYELAELNDKIAIKEKEQALLHEKIEKEKNETTKHYLELTYQSNEKAIDELRAQALSLMPEYARVFNSIAEYSAGVSRRLQRDLMRVFDEAKYDSANKKWTLTGSDGKQTILNDTQYRKEREKLTKEMRKSQSPFKKIKEAFKPSDKNGVKDYAQGIKIIGQELEKLGTLVSTIGNIAQTLGLDEKSTEDIDDIATSLEGLGKAAQGYEKFASGDYIGGITDMVEGTWTAINTWFDNSDKAISRQVKKSEDAIKRLELAYIDLEHAVDQAYGAGVVGAKRAMAAAKELELAELERQLALEQSRKKKNRDNDKILDLQKRIKELRYEIVDSIREITDELLGSDVGSFAENLVSSMAQAFKQGEDYMKVFNEQFDNMIDNMIIKSIVSKVVAQRIESLWDSMDEMIKERSDKESDTYAKAIQERERLESMGFEGWANQLGGVNWRMMNKEGQDALRNAYDRLLATAQSAEDEAKIAYDAATQITDSDISELITQVNAIKPELAESLKNALGLYWQFGQDKTSELSALQQGIQGVTEDTAGAIEAYMNGVSQQVYLHSDLLTQIRDTIIGFNMDAQLGTMAEMLRQLQNSYLIMQSMQSMMQGWTTPAGNGIRVELLS